ncbi:hypothetical protein ACFL06_00895 [Patescibacteria group bacterium]
MTTEELMRVNPGDRLTIHGEPSNVKEVDDYVLGDAEWRDLTVGDGDEAIVLGITANIAGIRVRRWTEVDHPGGVDDRTISHEGEEFEWEEGGKAAITYRTEEEEGEGTSTYAVFVAESGNRVSVEVVEEDGEDDEITAYFSGPDELVPLEAIQA